MLRIGTSKSIHRWQLLMGSVIDITSLVGRYDRLEKELQDLGLQYEQLEGQIRSLKERKLELELQAGASTPGSGGSSAFTRQEILQALNRLRDLEKQRDDLVNEQSHGGDERSRLLAAVKRDNRDVSSLESRIEELKNAIEERRSELEAFEDTQAIEKFKVSLDYLNSSWAREMERQRERVPLH